MGAHGWAVHTADQLTHSRFAVDCVVAVSTATATRHAPTFSTRIPLRQMTHLHMRPLTSPFSTQA